MRREFAKIIDLVRARDAGSDIEQRSGVEGSVLIVTVLRRLGPVGVNTHIAQVGELLAQQGQRVRVVSLDSWSPLLGPLLLAPSLLIRRARLARGIPLERYLTRRSLELSLRRRVRVEEPTVIYAQDARSAHAALRARRNSDIPVVMVVHFNESEAEELTNNGVISPGGRTDRTIRKFEATVIRQLDGLVFVSDFMRHHLEVAIPAARDIASAIIPNFLRDVEPAPAGCAPARGASRDCITVGYLVERKNHRYLLHVLAASRRLGRRYTLTIVGDGPQRGPLERLAGELGVADQVSFLGERSDVDHLLRQHRVYVHSSVMENCPFAVLEAFRAGLPVVTSAVGGIPEVVDDGSGRFWDLADPVDGAQTLAQLLEDDAALEHSARQARARFESTYDALVIGRELAGFLASVRRRLVD